MKGHLIAITVLLLGLASYLAAGMTGRGLALFFIGAALAISFWLHAVKAPRRLATRRPARFNPQH